MISNSFTDMDPFYSNPYGGRPVSYHANSIECFQLATHWIQRCLTEHDDCRQAVCPYEWTEEPDEDRRPSTSSCDESDDLEFTYPPPSKSIKSNSVGDSCLSRDPSIFGDHQSSQKHKSGFRTSMGLLSRHIPAPRHSKDTIEDGYWKLYLRSDSLKELEEEGSALLRARTIPLLPTRYIYVDRSPPQLCFAEPRSQGFYVALSHCWGDTQSPTTTTTTLAEHLKQLPMADMPQKFRDAVLITRELGIKYLWIDSLCILQGCKADWQRESSKMGILYSNAFLTISAAASTDSTQGIFRPRSVSSIPPVKIDPRDSDYTSLYVAQCSENTPFEKRQPIDSRAWCLQETTLSPRVLVYGTEMLGWLCDSTTDVEHGGSFDHEEDPCPPLLAPRLRHQIRHNPLKGAGGEFELSHYVAEKERATVRWPSIVNEFTRRKVTHESDRLPALSGLAKEIQLETGDEYLAGLWKRDLRYDLLWKVEVLFSDEDTEWKRPDKYRAPSWSWASIEGPVTLFLKSNLAIQGPEMREEPQRFRLLEANVDLVGLNPLGEVSGGYLKLHAGLKQVMIRERIWTTKENLPSSADTPRKEKRIQERYCDVFTLQGESCGRCCLDIPDEKDWSLTELWWLSLSMYEGLLITSAGKKGEYIRAGQVWFVGRDNTDSGLPSEFPEKEYQEVLLL